MWLAALAVGVYDVVLALGRPDLFPDLDVYRVAAATLAQHGRGLYDVVGSNGGPFTYPPIAAVLLWPLQLAPDAVAGIALAAVTLVAAILTARMSAPARPSWLTPAAVVLAMWTVPFRTTVFFGQVGVLLMALIAADLLTERPPWPRGILIGLASAVKLTPLLFVAFLLVTRRRREAATAVGVFAFATAAGAALLPDESHRYWLHDLWHFGRVGELNGVHNRSLWGVLGSVGVARWLTLLVVVAAVSIGLLRARLMHDRGSEVAAMTVVGLTSCLASPISWSHHLVWILPALACLLARRDRAWAIVTVAAVVVAYSRFSADARLVSLVETFATLALVLLLPSELRAHRPGGLLQRLVSPRETRVS